MNRAQLLTSWSKDQTAVLLNELEKYPLLYDATHPYYQIRKQRFAALREITLKVKPFKKNVNLKVLSLKIRSIKSQYCNEKRFIRNSLRNPEPGAKPYKSKLWCFEKLKFLDQKGTYDKDAPPPLLPEVEMDEEETNDELLGSQLEECNSNEYNDPIKSFEEVEVDNIYQQKETRTEGGNTRSEVRKECMKLLNCLTNDVTSVNHNNKGNATEGRPQQMPNTFLGLMVESELSKVPEEIYDDAKWKILRILEEASKKSRELKSRSVQIKLPSVPAYNVGSDTRVTVLNNHTLKTPMHKLNGSKIVIVPMQKK